MLPRSPVSGRTDAAGRGRREAPARVQPATFQGAVGLGGGKLEVTCRVDGAPTDRVWAEVAAITVLPGAAIAG